MAKYGMVFYFLDNLEIERKPKKQKRRMMRSEANCRVASSDRGRKVKHADQALLTLIT